MSYLPFIHIDSDAFHSFIKQVASKTKLKNRKVYFGKAADLAKSMKSELIMKLAEVEKVCMTVDHWTSYRKGFVDFTVHWYTNDLKRQNACIAIQRISGPMHL